MKYPCIMVSSYKSVSNVKFFFSIVFLVSAQCAQIISLFDFYLVYHRERLVSIFLCRFPVEKFVENILQKKKKCV